MPSPVLSGSETGCGRPGMAGRVTGTGEVGAGLVTPPPGVSLTRWRL
jgi:hypothetical protein